MADKNVTRQSLIRTVDFSAPASNQAEAQKAYAKAVREADGSNDPEKALAVGRAAARAYARTMKWLAKS